MSDLDSREVVATRYFTATPKEPSYTINYLMLFLAGVLLVREVCNIFLQTRPDCSVPLIVILILFIWGAEGRRRKKYRYEKAYKDAEPKPIDEQIDYWFEQSKHQILSGAPHKLGLRPDDISLQKKPLVIVGPASSTKFNIGYDGIIRFSAYRIVVIYLSDYHLGAYTCNLDLITGKLISEQTQEFHYTDVVSVSLLTSTRPFKVVTLNGVQHQIHDSQVFSVSAASGESIKVTIGFSQGENLFKGGTLPPTEVDFAIYALRMILREKKAGAQQQLERH